MSVHMKSNGTYFVRYRFQGKRTQKSFGKGEQGKLAAEAFNKSVLTKASDESTPFDDVVTDTMIDEEPVRYFDQLFYKYARRNPLKPDKKWFKDWKVTLNNHLYHDLSQAPIDQLTEEFIVNLVVSKFPDASPTTHSKYISYLKMTFEFGVNREFIAKNPLRFWKKLPLQKKLFDLTFEEIQSIHRVSPPHLALAIDIMVNTGVRTATSELLSLQWKNVLWDRCAIAVFAEKTQKPRVIPISSSLLDTLKEQRKYSKSDYLIEYQGRPVKSLSKAFSKACEGANIQKNVILYDIRHWYCTHLLSSGVNINEVSNYMGHSSAKMTLDVYGHVIANNTSQVRNLIPSI